MKSMDSLFDTILSDNYRKKYCQEFLSRHINDNNVSEQSNEYYINSINYIMSDECTDDIKKLQDAKLFYSPPNLYRIPKGNGKYRQVYNYDEKTRALLGFIAYSLHTSYDYLFCEGLCSYRKGYSYLSSCLRIVKTPNINELYCYKVDFLTYDHSIDEYELSKIIRLKIKDKKMSDFLCYFISDKRYIYNNKIYEDGPPVKTGSPLTTFFCKLYLSDYDIEISKKSQIYCRFSDDIIMYGSAEQINDCIKYSLEEFKNKKLTINNAKSGIYNPGEKIEYLGMVIKGDKLGISDKKVEAISQITRKKIYSILKLKRIYSLSDEFAMKIALQYLETYTPYFESLFRCINYIEGLNKIDRIMQNALRVIGSGKFGKSRYRIKYKQLKKIGYKPLVSKYYSWDWTKKTD